MCEELRGQRQAVASWRSIHDDRLIWLPTMAQRPPLQILEAHHCNYTAWRLFLLSVLWKMAESRHDAFSLVRLGKERRTIQHMLLDGEPGHPMDYPCWIYILTLQGQTLKGFMSSAQETRCEGHLAFELAFGGLGWLFIVGRQIESDTMRWLLLDRNGTMRLWRRDALEVRWFADGMQRLKTLQD